MNARPARTLSIPDGVALLVGIVIGMGVFKAPAIVADAAGSAEAALALWALGGLVSLMGALTYAELAAAYPDKGGEYHFLTRAYGRPLALMFGWARLTVIQTGTIAGAGFVLGDYLSTLLPLGPASSALYAAGAVIGLTIVQLLGLRMSAAAQSGLAALLVVAVATLIGFGLAAAPAPAPAPAEAAALPPAAAVGFAMIFVLLTYGGWNEAAYLSGEMRRPQRDMTIVLFVGVGLVTALYLGINWAYLHALGLEGVAASPVVGAALADAAFGPAGAAIVTLFVVAASLSTMNGTMFTGARSAFALGRDVSALALLARWDERRAAPGAAILIQGAISLALVGVGVSVGAGSNDAFVAMVAYTAPVFWLFFLLTGLAAIVLRWREPKTERPFRIPLFPAPPLLFCAAAGYMLWTSLAYVADVAGAGERAFAVGASLGVAVLLVGLLLIALARRGR